MDDFQLRSTFNIIIDEMLTEGNYEVMANGVIVNFAASSMFVTRTELTFMRKIALLPRTTRDKVRAVLDKIDDYRKSRKEAQHEGRR